MTQTFQISGITCDACVKVITRRVRKLPGVSEVHIEQTTGATDVISESPIGKNDIITALADTDYKVL